MIKPVLFLAAALVAVPASADVTVTFYARPQAYVPVFKIFRIENPGHAWVKFEGTLKDGTKVNESWGFAAVMPKGAEGGLRRWSDVIQAVTVTVPGAVRPDDGLVGEAHIAKTVDDAVFYRMKSTITAWQTQANTYHLLMQNCVVLADQIAADAGLARPTAYNVRPFYYMTELAKLNPKLWKHTPAPGSAVLDPDAYYERSSLYDYGIIFQNQAIGLSEVRSLLGDFMKGAVVRSQKTVQRREEARSSAMSNSLLQSQTISKQQTAINKAAYDAVEQASARATPVIFTTEPDFKAYLTHEPSKDTSPAPLYAAKGKKAQEAEALKVARRQVAKSPLQLRIGDSIPPSLSPLLWMGNSLNGEEREVELRLTAQEDMPLDITQADGTQLAVTLLDRNGGIKASEPGLLARYQLRRGEAVRLQLKYTSDAKANPFHRLILASKGQVFWDLYLGEFVFEHKDVSFALEIHSLKSGYGREFSAEYPLSLGPAPFGYTYKSHRAWIASLDPDHGRDCGSWALCTTRAASDDDVHVGLQIQGHGKSGFEAEQKAFSVNGYLEATYTLKRSEPVWIASDLPATF